jgi:hypothetical protein
LAPFLRTVLIKQEVTAMIIIIPLVILVGIIAWMLRPGMRPAGPRLAAILFTALPPLVLAVVAVVAQLLHSSADVADISNTCFIVGLALIAAAILASIGFALTRKSEIARGIGFGVCIAVVVSVIELALLEWLGGV